MKKFGLALIAALALGSNAAFAVPVTETENDIYGSDAPSPTNGGTYSDFDPTTNQLTGTLGDTSDTSDSWDIFGLPGNWSDGLFSATTSSDFTMYLLDANDITPALETSTIVNTTESLLQYDLLAGTDYLLGISGGSGAYTIDLSYTPNNAADRNIPEPTPLALLALGLLGLALGRSKRA